MNTKKNINLKELIILIIIILAIGAFLFPSISHPPARNPEFYKAQGDLIAIKTAVINYEIRCGELPWEKGKDKQFSKYLSNADFDIFFELLTCQDGHDPGQEVKGNAKNTRFLAKADESYTKGWTDPWGNGYIIFLDTDYDGKITIDGKEIEGKVQAYSYGKNKIDEKGKNDDLCTWE